MPVQERRRLIVLGAILGAVIAIFVAKSLLVSDDKKPFSSSTPAASNPFEPRLASTTLAPNPHSTTTTKKHVSTTPPTFQVYSNKNPFEPVIQVTGSTGPTATTRQRPRSSSTTTSHPPSTATSAPSNNPAPGQTVTLIDVFRDASGTLKAHVQVGSTVYTVAQGTRFANGAYRVVSLDMNGARACGQFQYGDASFRLCQGEQTLK